MNCLEKIKDCKFYLSLDDKYKNILSKRFNKINWKEAADDEYAICLMEKYFDKYDWYALSSGFKEVLLNVIPFFEKHPRFIAWPLLSLNTFAIDLLEKNLDKISWENLSQNPSAGAIKLLEKNIDKISWYYLSGNPTAEAIKLLENNIDKINWNYLSQNPCAIDLLENNLDKINWNVIEHNNKRDILMENIVNNGKARMLLDNIDAVLCFYYIDWNNIKISQQEKEAIRKEVKEKRSHYFNSFK